MKAFRAAPFLLLLALSSQACAQGAEAVSSRRADSTRTAGMEGEVQCVAGDPVTSPPLPSLSGLERAENIRHEAVHAAQLAVGCDSVMAIWQSDPAYRLALESEATCTALKVWPDSLRRARQMLAVRRIAESYLNSLGNTLGFEDVYESLEHWCGG